MPLCKPGAYTGVIANFEKVNEQWLDFIYYERLIPDYSMIEDFTTKTSRHIRIEDDYTIWKDEDGKMDIRELS